MAKPQIAISGYEFKTLSFSQILDYLAQLGVRRLELWPYNVEGEDLAQARRELASRHMEVSCVSAMSAARLNQEPTDQARQAIQRAITLARELGAPYVTTYMGATPSRDPFTTLKLYVAGLAPCLEEAAKHNITILLENMFDHRNEDPQGTKLSRSALGTLAVAEAVASPHFGITYDPCNFHIAAIEPYPYGYDLLKPHIRNVHIKDTTLYNERLHRAIPDPSWVDSITGRWLSLPAGQGAVNFYGLFQRLRQDQFDGYITLDIMTPVEGRDAIYRQSVEFVRRMLDI